MARAYVALGSNLDEPIEQVQKGIEAVKNLPTTKLIQASSLYKTVPVGYDDQPDFINAVVSVETRLPCEAFLMRLLEIEFEFGRVRTFPNAPRVIDLDLLMYGDEVRTSDFITIPHARMHERAFVIMPLAEIAPDLVLETGGAVTDLVATLNEVSIHCG